VKPRSQRAVARRATQARTVVLLMIGVLAAAFFRVQVLRSARYQVLSESNRLRAVPLPAPRGLIEDRHGLVIAENIPGYAVALNAPSESNLLSTLTRLQPVLGFDSLQRAAVVERYQLAPSEPVLLVRDAPFDMISALEERRPWNPGLVIQSTPRRRYPYGAAVAHVIGYVGEINERELRSPRYEGVRPGTLLGRAGIEQYYDGRLRGRDGVQFSEVDVLGRTVRAEGIEERLEPVPGETIRTTIDVRLQQFVDSVFPAGSRGAVVAMKPSTGEILALYSAPTFDPNQFIGGIDPSAWAALVDRGDFPLFNRAIQARYPPASPFKLAIAAMALRRGLVDIDSHMEVPCRGGLQYYTRYFRCWSVNGHGDLSLREAIQYSCDVYFYQLGLKIGLDSLLRDGVTMGFAERTGVDLPDEKDPVFPPSTDYYNRRYGPRGWTNAVTLNLAIGQGENSQTLMNMVRYYAMLASVSGSAPQPHLVENERPERQSLGLTASDLDDLRHALIAVVDRGTATGARIADLQIAGKTGTAQNAQGPDHGWFVGFAPADNPQIVVGAIVEFAEHGSSVAPLVTRIMARYLIGPDAGFERESELRIDLPSDSAPAPLSIMPDSAHLRGMEPDSERGTPRIR
jgi:penicillin-binding protein 2